MTEKDQNPTTWKRLYDLGYKRGFETAKGFVMEKKPGYKTTEFWLSFVAIALGGLKASGAIEGSSVEGWVGLVISALAALGYSATRGWVKGKEIESDTIKEIEAKKVPGLDS